MARVGERPPMSTSDVSRCTRVHHRAILVRDQGDYDNVDDGDEPEKHGRAHRDLIELVHGEPAEDNERRWIGPQVAAHDRAHQAQLDRAMRDQQNAREDVDSDDAVAGMQQQIGQEVLGVFA